MFLVPILIIVYFGNLSLEVYFGIVHMLPREAHFIRKGKF